ncbi:MULTISPECIES: glycosyltransferase family 29 protein [unclassified Bartonella]|uniref:glycosyltransferase family 29 protein n=1 Tax=unclassified Bartonella TaxID=2645622 RepID=UPI001FEEA248|nr:MULTISPECIES: glycosyltransferase family 29 protein [unclassified Bartonella]UXN03985.1 glycosyltransferase family 29 protein [Bartonella sp. HY406]UXN06968.1 glycosyltransferase family 29 protein [Bartonella sp. HY761]
MHSSIAIENRKTCFIVGNGDLSRDFSAEINNADYVLRFNEPRMLGGWAGLKTDCLMLANSGKPMQTKLYDSAFIVSPFFEAARELIFVYHPNIMRRYFKRPLITSRLLKGRKVDWTAEAIKILGEAGKPITIMPPQFYLSACRDIGIEGEGLYKQFPSTGYLGMWRTLKRFWPAEWQINIIGFGFEGWKRHNWDAERQWVETRMEEGVLTLFN